MTGAWTGAGANKWKDKQDSSLSSYNLYIVKGDFVDWKLTIILKVPLHIPNSLPLPLYNKDINKTWYKIHWDYLIFVRLLLDKYISKFIASLLRFLELYVHTYIHTYIHTYTHTPIHPYTHARTHARTHTRTHTHTHCTKNLQSWVHAVRDVCLLTFDPCTTPHEALPASEASLQHWPKSRWNHPLASGFGQMSQTVSKCHMNAAMRSYFVISLDLRKSAAGATAIASS